MGMDKKMFGSASESSITAALDALITKRLGHGAARTTYEIIGCSDYVLKLHHTEESDKGFQNVMEYSLWQSVMYEESKSKWLAECKQISFNGRALIQERLEIITNPDDRRLPKRVPKILTDIKPENWGVSEDGTVKCCDYGILLLNQEQPWKLVKATWRESG